LTRMLNDNDWWLRAVHAEQVCKLVDVLYCDEPAYYRDIYVWLPDVRWGENPFCPECNSNTSVAAHCWRTDDDIGRRICHITTHYFALSRRYICHDCESIAKRVKEQAAVLAQAAGYRVVAEDEKTDAYDTTSPELQPAAPAYSFMAWDHRSLPLLPYGHGSHFPAFLTHRNGCDKHVIDLMRSLFDKGLRPDSLSKTMLELHAKKYTQDYIMREHDVAKRRKQPYNQKPDPGMFSTFSDTKCYAGLVQTDNQLLMGNE
jgi:hypothetical protein